MIISTQNDLRKFHEQIAEIVGGCDNGMQYTGLIEIKKKDRSNAKNRLALKWYDFIGSHTGHGKEYERAICKWHVGFPILLANDKDGSVTKFWDTLVSTMEYEQILDAMEFIEVTRLMTARQFTEYLETIERAAAVKGIVLPRPDDYYWEAMGATREKPRGEK